MNATGTSWAADTVAPPSVSECSRFWRIGGRVQGVGFRPFVYRLAHRLSLRGWVRNSAGSVEIYAEGSAPEVEAFGRALIDQAPPASRASLLEARAAPREHTTAFRILPSVKSAPARIHVPPDLFACDECLAELRDPLERRYRYPFINCTQCGPRYTLIRALPYDRPNTTMADFALCAACAAEYAQPLDRRFHAQPLACALCGPRLRWHVAGGELGEIHDNEAALRAGIGALRAGNIIAVRGIGGYHLLCDASREDAVALLRERKHRPGKPFALMVPWRGTDGLNLARRLSRLSPSQALALTDVARPIVLVTRRDSAPLAASIAPGLREVGLMLPYSPLHHLLLDAFGGALVATSGNLSGEPVLTEPQEAVERLGAIADGFLHHDRPIARPADDPVLRVITGQARPLRLGRGTAPLDVPLPGPIAVPTLAVGAFLKNTVALAWGDRAVISPHIGDLTSPRGRAVFAQVIEELQQLYDVRAQAIVHDAHPDFPNTRWAGASGLPTRAVWHHYAHASALAGEYPGDDPLLCFAWDGVGLGPDGTLWGGEGLLGRPGAWRRVSSFRPFRLPGGERAARAPWRSAQALCWESDVEWRAGNDLADPLIRLAFERQLNAPRTTAVGRLFDAAAALVGVCRQASYEGEAPMRLEALCEGRGAQPMVLPLKQDESGVWRSDWAPLLPMLLDDARPQSERSATFHCTLAQALCDQAVLIRQRSGIRRVGLTGGVFQNSVLSAQADARLRAADFEVLIPRQLPVNDGAISYGQLVEAAASTIG